MRLGITGWRFGGRPETRENETLYREAILAVRHRIYLESRYAASPLIADLLAQRLDEPQAAVGMTSARNRLSFNKRRFERTIA